MGDACSSEAHDTGTFASSVTPISITSVYAVLAACLLVVLTIVVLGQRRSQTHPIGNVIGEEYAYVALGRIEDEQELELA